MLLMVSKLFIHVQTMGSVESDTLLDQEKLPGLAKFKEHRLQATVGVSILGYLDQILPIREARDSVPIVTTLATFTCERDPWTSPEAYTKASSILAIAVPCTPTEKEYLGDLLRSIHERTIKPIFSASKNPDITPAGRRNLYPVHQSRFNPSLFSTDSEPWKNQCVYVITVLSWVLSQYPVCCSSRAVVILIKDESSIRG